MSPVSRSSFPTPADTRLLKNARPLSMPIRDLGESPLRSLIMPPPHPVYMGGKSKCVSSNSTKRSATCPSFSPSTSMVTWDPFRNSSDSNCMTELTSHAPFRFLSRMRPEYPMNSFTMTAEGRQWIPCSLAMMAVRFSIKITRKYPCRPRFVQPLFRSPAPFFRKRFFPVAFRCIPLPGKNLWEGPLLPMPFSPPPRLFLHPPRFQGILPAS